MTDIPRPSRRQFVAQAAALGAPLILPAGALGDREKPAASGRVTLGVIGTGNQGLNDIRGFLGEGHRVKVSVFFRGRSITHPELGRAMLDRIAEKVSDVATVEQQPRLEGRSMAMMLIAK